MNTFKTLGLAATLALGSAAANASPINVGGVIFDPDSLFDMSSVSSVYESVTTTEGTTIQGHGVISQLNVTFPATFCPGCELTFEFGGYTLMDLDPLDLGGPGNGIAANGDFAFTGGWLNVYVDHTPDFNPADISSSNDGTLWLSLAGVIDPLSNYGSTLEGTLTNLVDVNGGGLGYLDVVGGIAASNFDTNNANNRCDISGGLFCPDIFYNSDFDFDEILAIASGGTLTHSGSTDLRGDTIPEPSTIALLGLSLLGFGAARRKLS